MTQQARSAACMGPLFALLVTLGNVSAQRPAPPGVLRDLGVARAQLEFVSMPATTQCEPLTVDVAIAGDVRTLRLRPHDMRSPAYAVLVDDGSSLRPVDLPAPRTFRGTVDGDADSLVSASLTDDGRMYALVVLGDAIWAIEPSRDANAMRNEYVVYQSLDILPLPFTCGLRVSPVIEQAGGGSVESTSRGQAPLVAEIAIEADHEYFSSLGSNIAAVQADVMLVMNNVDAIYQRDVGVIYSITQIIVNTASYGTSDPDAMLSRMRSRWSSSYSGVPRDVAHLFTGVDLDGTTIGIAYLSGICNSNQYGLSQSRFAAGIVSRTALTAHELGHNWSASHCSGGDCRIMCPVIGGCSTDMARFGAASANAIAAYRDTKRGCLGGLGVGYSSDGGDIAYANLDNNPRPDMVLMSYDDPAGANSFFYVVGWNVDENSFTTQWSAYGLSGFGNDGEGAGIAVGQFDADPRPDFVVMAYDAPSGANQFVYKLLLNVDAAGRATTVTGAVAVGGVGNSGDGAGVTIVQLDMDPRPDLVLMAYDDPAGANDFRYRVVFNVDANAANHGVSPSFAVGGVGNDAEGAGVAAGRFNANDTIDLVFMAYDVGSPANEIRYKFAYDIDSSGAPRTVSAPMSLPGHGNVGQGAGVAVTNLNSDLHDDVVFAVIDAPTGANTFRWTTVYDVAVIRGGLASLGVSCPVGMRHEASGSYWIGSTVSLNLTGAPLLKPALMHLGFSTTNWGSVPLPLHLDFFGAPNCFLFTEQSVMFTTATTFLGTASYGLAIPTSSALGGASFYTQYIVLDPAMNRAGIAVSNAAAVTIGG